eukprot:2717874-Rhodomonas_salina.1
MSGTDLRHVLYCISATKLQYAATRQSVPALAREPPVARYRRRARARSPLYAICVLNTAFVSSTAERFVNFGQ